MSTSSYRGFPRSSDLALVFVDFSKVFDSVDHAKMFEILSSYGIPEEIIFAIKVLYTDTSSTILTYTISVDSTSNKGFEIRPRRSAEYPAQHLTDTDLQMT